MSNIQRTVIRLLGLWIIVANIAAVCWLLTRPSEADWSWQGILSLTYMMSIYWTGVGVGVVLIVLMRRPDDRDLHDDGGL